MINRHYHCAKCEKMEYSLATCSRFALMKDEVIDPLPMVIIMLKCKDYHRHTPQLIHNVILAQNWVSVVNRKDLQSLCNNDLFF